MTLLDAKNVSIHLSDRLIVKDVDLETIKDAVQGWFQDTWRNQNKTARRFSILIQDANKVIEYAEIYRSSQKELLETIVTDQNVNSWLEKIKVFLPDKISERLTVHYISGDTIYLKAPLQQNKAVIESILSNFGLKQQIKFIG